MTIMGYFFLGSMIYGMLPILGYVIFCAVEEIKRLIKEK
jgi:hypothetical protein